MAKIGRDRTLAILAAVSLLVALIDWRLQTHVPYAILWAYPAMLAASFLPRWLVALVGIVFTVGSAMLGSLIVAAQAATLTACGLLFGELLRQYRTAPKVDGPLQFLENTMPSATVSPARTVWIPPLSSREASVLCLVAQGLANKEIAARMEMPESRVKGTLQRLFAKNGVRTRSQLVRVAIDRYPELLYHSTDPGTSTRTRYSIEQAQAWEQAASGR